MQLQLCTWAEVENHLKNSTGIIVPIGSTEQHGPNGLIGTDALTAELIARGIGEAVDALVAPTIAVGMAQHHMAFTGSMTLRPSTLIAVVRDMVQSLARHGFRRFFIVNGHGGNTASINAAFFEVYTEAPRFIKDGDAVRLLLDDTATTTLLRQLSRGQADQAAAGLLHRLADRACAGQGMNPAHREPAFRQYFEERFANDAGSTDDGDIVCI